MTDEDSKNLIEIGKLIVPLLGGGAIGAIITLVVTNRRNRIQPISKSVTISDIYAPGSLLQNHITRITFSGSTISGNASNYDFTNLFIAQIEIENTGNKDFVEFNFGITLPKAVTAINVKSEGSDRSHTITNEPEINFGKASNTIDFKLKPFNRKDKYSMTLFLTSTENSINNEIVFSTQTSIRFVDKKFLPIGLNKLITIFGNELLNVTFPFMRK